MGGLTVYSDLVKDMPAKLAIISYRAGVSGDVLAEYADDKIRFSLNLNINTFLVTALGTQWKTKENLRIFAVPSLSYIDFKLEIENLRKYKGTLPTWVNIYKMIPATVGRLFDFLYIKMNKDFGYARWSWSVNAVLVGTFIRLIYGVKDFYAVGSAAAYLTGLGTKIFTGIKLYIEVPDPIIGSEMFRTSLKTKIITIFERSLIKNSKKFILITNRNLVDTKQRHPKLADKLSNQYPSAWNFGLQNSNKKNKKIQFAHIGSLYGNRNLDILFRILDEMYNENKINKNEIEIKNVGQLLIESPKKYLERQDFLLINLTTRKEALQIAQDSDFLLLIQHSDTRSKETIPYKLYDYLNLNKPIFCIIDNDEIIEIINKNQPNTMKLYSNINDESSIRIALISALQMNKTMKNQSIKLKGLNFNEGFSSIFD